MTADIALPWLLGALIGSMLFFAVAVAPSVFRALPAEHGGAFLRRLFPQYYLWGIVMAILCSLAAFYAADRITLGTCAAVALLFIYARQSLMPRINRARDSELEGNQTSAKTFRLLHLQSVLINGLQLLLLIGISFYPLWR